MRKMSIFLGLVVALTLGSPSIHAQLSTGTISGTVSDSTGAVLPGVEVTILNVDTGLSRLAVTGDEGSYRAPSLNVGTYEVRASLPGFQTAVRQGVGLSVGQEAVIDLNLQVGEITQEVVVTGEAPLVNTSQSTLSEVIDEKQVHDLPLNSRNLIQLSLLSPGVTQARNASYVGETTSPAGVKISMSGARIYMTGYLLDGVDITDSSRASGIGGASGSLFGVETIREFQILTNSFSAQYGRFAGGIISLVTKSGTNAFHGSAFFFHRNDNLDARNFFDRDVNNPTVRSDGPEFRRHQFGGTIGGPIASDRSFFFFSYEGFREDTGQSLFAVVPNADAHNGLLPLTSCPPGDERPGGLCFIDIDPAHQPLVDLYPLPNGNDLGQGTGEFFATKSAPVNEDFVTVRFDHQLSDSDSFFGRYTISDGDRVIPAAIVGDGWFSDTAQQYVTLEWKHIFSPNVINTFRVGFQRTTWSQEPPADELCGGQGCGGQPIYIGLIPSDPFGRLQPGSGIKDLGLFVRGKNVTNAFSYVDDLFITRGKHSLKTGVSVTRYQNNDFFNGFYGGEYRFSSLESFLKGTPFFWIGALPGSSSQRGFRETVIGFYLQDDFKWKPNLTVNLGLRYEFITDPSEVNEIQWTLRDPLDPNDDFTNEPPFFKNPSKRNFAPRIGLAWDPFGDGKTSIRSAFGVFHDTLLFYHYANQGRRNPPPQVVNVIIGPVCQCLTYPRPPADGGPPGAALLQTAEFEPSQPYMMQWNLAVQREVWAETTVTVSYVGSRGVHLLGHRNINVAEPTGIVNGRKEFNRPFLPRRNPKWGNIFHWDFGYNSFYHGWQASAKKRFGGGLQFQASYTMGRSIDEFSRTNTGDFSAAGVDPVDPYDVRGSNRALSDHHVQHAFSFNYAYDLPIRGLSGVAHHILEGWQISGIVSLNTGNPLQIILGGGLGDHDRDRDTNTAQHRPDLVPGASNNPVQDDGRNPDQYFDPSAFEVQPPGFYGNVGRNTLIGPGVATFDFSLMKNSALSEAVNLQFRAEFFNIFNRANFGQPTQIREGVEVFANAAGDVLPNAGRINNTSTSARQIQVALKLMF